MAGLVSGVVGLVSFVFCYLLPAYSSFKALRSGNRKTVIKLLIHYTVISLLAGIEVPADVFLGWLPFYTLGKLLLVLWLTLPQTQGSIFIYRNLIHPQLLAHEPAIDNLLKQAELTAWEYAEIARDRTISAGRDLVRHYSAQGQRMIVENLQDPSQILTVAGKLYMHVQTISAKAAAAPAVASATTPRRPEQLAAEVKNDVSPASSASTSLIHDLDDDDDDDATNLGNIGSVAASARSRSSSKIIELSDNELDDAKTAPEAAGTTAPAAAAAAADDVDWADEEDEEQQQPQQQHHHHLHGHHSHHARIASPAKHAAASPRQDVDVPFSDADVSEEIRLSSPWRVLRALQLPLQQPQQHDDEPETNENLFGAASASPASASAAAAPAAAPLAQQQHQQNIVDKHVRSVGVAAKPAKAGAAAASAAPAAPLTRRISSSKHIVARPRLSIGGKATAAPAPPASAITVRGSRARNAAK